MASTVEQNRAYRAEKRAQDPDWGVKQYSRIKKRLNSDPAVFVANKIAKQKHAAQRRGIEWTLNHSSLTKRLLKATHCALSGRELVFKIGHPNSPSIDRKNSKLGYTPRNTQIVCYAVNIAKMASTDREFIKLCQDIAHYNGKTKP